MENIAETAMKRIRYLRRIREVNQTRAAEGIGVDQQTWSDVESGKRKIDLAILQKIADFFQVPIDYFVTDENRAKQILAQVITGVVEFHQDESSQRPFESTTPRRRTKRQK